MLQVKNPNKITLASQTKKIKKQKLSSPSDDLQDESGLKKYTTFSKSQKINVISDFRKMLLPKITEKDYCQNDMILQIENLSKVKYNQAIEHILSVHAPSSLKWKGDKKEWQKYLKQWRRQLKNWIKNIDKPETRGSARIVPLEKTAEFKQRIIKILQSLPSRTFELLREKVLEAIRDMMSHHSLNENNEVSSPDCMMNENMFSKHFWYDYTKANPDVAELYSSLPITRTNPKKKQTQIEKETNSEFNDDQISSPSSVQNYQTSNSTICSPDNTNSSQFNFTPETKDIFYSEDSSSSLLRSVSTQETACYIENWDNLASFEIPVLNVEDYLPMSEFSFPEIEQEKMIVESEDNETQRSFFRDFYHNGMNI